jgi:hypothetical protein
MHLHATFEKKKKGLKHHVVICKLLYNVVNILNKPNIWDFYMIFFFFTKMVVSWANLENGYIHAHSFATTPI